MIEVFHLTEFAECNEVVDRLRKGQAIALHLACTDPDDHQRVIDYLAGAAYTLLAQQVRVSPDVYLFYLNCVFQSKDDALIRDAEESTHRLNHAHLLVSNLHPSTPEFSDGGVR